MERQEASKQVYEDIQQIKTTLRDISFQLERLIILTQHNTPHAEYNYKKLIRYDSQPGEWKTIP